MSPSATTNERRPSVHERHATAPFGPQGGAPPSAMVVEALSDEPEIEQLFSLRNSSVVVTGGARGLGVTIAAACVESGADVLCCDILPEPSQPEWSAMESKAKRHGAHIKYVRLDICDSQQVDQCFEQYKTEARFPLLGVVHCAGVIDEQDAMEYDMQVFNRIMRVNVDGTMIVAKAAARVMREAKSGGSIVLMASISGSIANRGLKATAYNTSKSGVLQMCRSLAAEWGQYNIRVNTLSPGYIRTAMTAKLLEDKPDLLAYWKSGNPLGRIGEPKDLKGPAIYLLSSASNFVSGTDIKIDGGHCAW